MKYKGPKITSFNQTRRRLEKTDLERLLNPKKSTRLTKGHATLTLQNAVHNIKYPKP